MCTSTSCKILRVTAAIVAGACVLICYDPYGYFSICTQCGATCSTKVFHLPFTNTELFQFSSTHESDFSNTLTSLHLKSEHEHHWLMARGGGHGVLCALGKGRQVAATAMDNDVTQLIISSKQFADAEFTERLVHGVLDPSTTQAAWQLAQLFAAAKPACKNDFETWKAEEIDLITTDIESPRPSP